MVGGAGRVARYLEVYFPKEVVIRSCFVSRTTRYLSYRLHKVWRVIVQGGKTSRGPCTPWGLEAGFMDKVPGIKFHLVQF